MKTEMYNAIITGAIVGITLAVVGSGILEKVKITAMAWWLNSRIYLVGRLLYLKNKVRSLEEDVAKYQAQLAKLANDNPEPK